MRPLRVLHVCDKFGVAGSTVHGVSRFLARIIPRFDRARVEPLLVGLRPEDHASAHLRALGLALHCLGKGKFDLSTAPALLRLARRERADLLHLHGYGATNFGRLVARWAGLPCIVHEHFVDPAPPKVQVPWDLALRRICDAAIAVSESVRRFMVERRFVPAERIELLRYGVPLAEYRPALPEQALAVRQRYGLAPDAVVLGAVGRLDEQKGLRYLLEAVARLTPEHPGLVLLLVGDGPLRGELGEQAAALGIAGRTVFTGHSSEVPLLQSALDVQLFPSLWEGTPLALFEAMAMARTIVSTDVDGLGEVLCHGETALLVPPRDPAALAAALHTVLADPGLARRLAANAEVASRGHDVQHTVDRLEAIYLRLAPGGGRAALPAAA